MLTLYITPVVYVYMEGFVAGWKRRPTGAPSVVAGGGEVPVK
jgi:hypothetical protein